MSRLVSKIDSPLVKSSDSNFSINSWPPQDDFAIVVDKEGAVISRFQDSVWDLTRFHTRTCRISFYAHLGPHPEVCERNLYLSKLIAAWFIYGNRAPMRAHSIKSLVTRIISFVKIFSALGLRLDRISCHPELVPTIAARVKPSIRETLIVELRLLLVNAEDLGFLVMDNECLKVFFKHMSAHVRRQTPYIPDRIWSHQISRAFAFANDLREVSQEIRNCYAEAKNAHAKNVELFHAQGITDVGYASPFFDKNGGLIGKTYISTFSEFLATNHLSSFVEKWICDPRKARLTTLGKILSMAQFVAHIIIINLTGMRYTECATLRSGAFKEERDVQLGDVFFIEGEPLKGNSREKALWVTCREAEIAFWIFDFVREVRGIDDQKSELVSKEDRFLLTWASDPGMRKHDGTDYTDLIPSFNAYSTWKIAYPRIFDTQQLVITQADLDEAHRVNTDLDLRKFRVGSVWPLAWHQIRRTTAISMASSGLVSAESMQYQLKHLRRNMTLYYGRGFGAKNLCQDMQVEFIKAAYEGLSIESSMFSTDRYVSPLGEEHKFRILSRAKGSRGEVTNFRRTALGICLKSISCEFGGYENFTECSGQKSGKPCPDAMYDAERKQILRSMLKQLEHQLVDKSSDDPNRDFISLQIESLRSVLGAIE